MRHYRVMVYAIDSNSFAQEQVMRVVRRSMQGDHPTQGEDKPSPLRWTSQASRFGAGAHLCGRPAVAVTRSGEDHPDWIAPLSHSWSLPGEDKP
jgi:hypothetical protein